MMTKLLLLMLVLVSALLSGCAQPELSQSNIPSWISNLRRLFLYGNLIERVDLLGSLDGLEVFGRLLTHQMVSICQQSIVSKS